MKTMVILLALVPTVGIATVDHLAKTYQPLYCPQEGIQIVPVYFLTWGSSPEMEISMVAATNAMLPRSPVVGGGNANLASIFGLSVRPGEIKHQGPVSVVVDMTGAAKPEGYEYSVVQVLGATVECLTRLLQEHGHTVLHIAIKCPRDKLLPEWKRYQKSYELTKERKE